MGESCVLGRCIELVLEAGVRNVVVAVPVSAPDGLMQLLAGYPVTVVTAGRSSAEMMDSVLLALGKVDGHSSGVMILPGDIPLVRVDTVREMIRRHSEMPERILLPVFRGRRGHPPVFPVSEFHELGPGENLRDMIRRNPERVEEVVVDDRGILFDLDTVEDYQRMCTLWNRSGNDNDSSPV